MMDNLKRWGDGKPKVGRTLIIYPPEHDYGFWVRACERAGKIVVDGPETMPMQSLHPDTRWCYVPPAPDWSEL